MRSQARKVMLTQCSSSEVSPRFPMFMYVCDPPFNASAASGNWGTPGKQRGLLSLGILQEITLHKDFLSYSGSHWQYHCTKTPGKNIACASCPEVIQISAAGQGPAVFCRLMGPQKRSHWTGKVGCFPKDKLERRDAILDGELVWKWQGDKWRSWRERKQIHSDEAHTNIKEQVMTEL